MAPTIVVDFHDSDRSRDALALARGSAIFQPLVRHPGAAHPTVACADNDRLFDQRRSRINEALDAVPVHPAAELVVTEGEPTEVLSNCSRELGQLDLGSRGYGPLRRVLLGSVSNGGLDRAACPVMSVPCGAERPRSEPGGEGSSATHHDLRQRR